MRVDFFFNGTATTEIYTLSLHTLFRSRRQPVVGRLAEDFAIATVVGDRGASRQVVLGQDRKSTRLNSSHGYISYAVFCLKKKTRSKGCPRAIRAPAAGALCSSLACIVSLSSVTTACGSIFFLMVRPPPRSTLFPYTRSSDLDASQSWVAWPKTSR